MRRGLLDINIDDSRVYIKTNRVLFFVMFGPPYAFVMATMIWYFFNMNNVADEMLAKTLCIVMMLVGTVSWFSLPVLVFKEITIDETGLSEKRLFRNVKTVAWPEIRKIHYVNKSYFAFYTKDQKPFIVMAYQGIENIIKKFSNLEIVDK